MREVQAMIQKKRVRIVLVLIIVALLSIIVTQALLYYFKYVYKVKQITVYDVKLTLDDYVGFNVDPGEINFGTVIPGGGSSREVYLKTDSPTKVVIKIEGNVSKFVGVSENNFIFIGNRTLNFIAATPENATKGYYAGRVIIIFKEP